jgi:hypothetical protein
MRDYACLYTKLLADLEVEAGYDPHIYSDMDARQSAKISLASSFFKKLAPLGSSKTADSNALDKFLSINAGIDPTWRFEAGSEIESLFWDYFCDHLNSATHSYSSESSFSLDSIRDGLMTGPGAAQKADATTFYSKLFESTMSFTNPDLIRYYRAALVETGLWCDAERLRNENFGFTRVKGGKIFFAPKNAEISRTCCTEAHLNMLVQKSIGTFLEKSLGDYFGVSLSTQPDFNRRLARLGSIDGSFGTIDLVSASDSIAVRLISLALRPGFLKTMMFMSRSELLVLPNGELVEPRMISTMGNGFTFPLQTVIFASAVRAVYQLMGFPSTSPVDHFGVFGDDIVVRREAYDFTCQMLTKLGFQVNDGKSFNTGPFRESCGHDFHTGSNIRGVYIRSLETPQEVYSAINRLMRWSALHDHELPTTIALLKSWVRDIRVPPTEADDAGIHVPFCMTRPKVTNAYWFQYRCYVRRNRKVSFIEPDQPEHHKEFNPYGIGVGFLSGHIRRRDISLTSTTLHPDSEGNLVCSAWLTDGGWGMSSSVRSRRGERSRYQVVRKSLPYWDLHTDTKMYDDSGWEYWRPALTGRSRQRWEALAVANLQFL